jgi:hypothetical protein
MPMKKIGITGLLVLLLAVLLSLGAAQAETKKFSGASEAIKWIKKNQPQELTVEGKFKPVDLLKVKNAMPEGSEFHFSVTWGDLTYTDESTEIIIGAKKAVTEAHLEAFISLCPNLKVLDNSKNLQPTNSVMIPLMEKYPDIHFEWVVSLGKGHRIATNATVFTTKLPPESGRELTSEKLQLLKYCPNLKALDIGHNKATDLDFLKYVPDLELLIIGDNDVTDITPIGQLKHLQFAELFSNPFTDISALANCTELLDLNITNCQVHDFSPLDNVQTLERFWANMIKHLTEEEAQHFKDHHPNCICDFQPSHAATVDGWRSENPHYKHYIWCFKNKQWIPFNEEIPGVKKSE